MAAYIRSSRKASCPPPQKLWDPSSVLGIINTDAGYHSITCSGYAPSQRRRCRNPIRMDNRALITETLDEISYLSPNDPRVMKKLRVIAEPALCVRYHQGQAGELVRKWAEKIKRVDVKPRIRERETTMEDLKERMKEMQELLDRLQEAASMVGLVDEHQEEASQRRNIERREARKVEKERLERERVAEERRKREEEEHLERDRVEKERVERQRLAEERRKREEEERLEKELLEKERLEEEKTERAASNERIRQRAQKRREEAEQLKRKKEQKEKEEWDQLWTSYQNKWTHFKACASIEGNLRDAIPWPVKSGLYRDVGASKVKDFMQHAMPKDANMRSLIRKECLKWHENGTISRRYKSKLTPADQLMIDMICRVMTDVLDASAGRSADFDE
ncbi:Reticulocyte-binding protein 2-like protein a [Lachnellula suecica]|uniref:Reticulocyte-binding protein 2-like protein a n=1 Tax=Lachnellula suecica TaxID=602035 RepID=A0A8T9C8C8_9HELO|nr:Reticulocyte-binding protein 2-like protein a [Lachnellula suecica]